MLILFDTDYIIDYLKGDSTIYNTIVECLKINALHISILTVYELYAGMRENEKEATHSFIEACQVHPITLEIARNAGLFRMKQRQRGITLSVVDCIIAETARAKGFSVATKNKKHYPQTVLWGKS